MEDDYTEREKEIEMWFKRLKDEEMRRGVEVQVGCKKIKIKGDWFEWDEKMAGLVERVDRGTNRVAKRIVRQRGTSERVGLNGGKELQEGCTARCGVQAANERNGEQVMWKEGRNIGAHMGVQEGKGGNREKMGKRGRRAWSSRDGRATEGEADGTTKRRTEHRDVRI
ncbi:hypothetical protein M0802_010748 [Mischocyttarus mexicanus]|nr:hypothetical protein M0802_010748 [Mischocyttarus mexicanus]